jgi:hypothetical protein
MWIAKQNAFGISTFKIGPGPIALLPPRRTRRPLRGQRDSHCGGLSGTSQGIAKSDANDAFRSNGNLFYCDAKRDS